MRLCRGGFYLGGSWLSCDARSLPVSSCLNNPTLPFPIACSGRAECLLADVWERLQMLCSQNCEPRYDFGSVVERAAELGAKRLIICDPGGCCRELLGLQRAPGLQAPLSLQLHCSPPTGLSTVSAT